MPEPSDAIWSDRDLAENPHQAQDKADRVRRMFDAIARSYDLNNRVHSFGRDQAWRRAAVRAATPATSDDVLDAACGTGDLAQAFQRAGVRSVTGVDFTAGMLEIARHKARKSEQAIRYDQGDVMKLPYNAESFDIVSIAFGIRNVQQPEKAIDEFFRVLRPGGRLVILEFGRPRNPVIRVLNDLYTRRIMPLTATLLARDRSGAYRYLPRSIDTFLDQSTLCAAIDRAGFSDVSVRSLTFGVCLLYRAVKPR